MSLFTKEDQLPLYLKEPVFCKHSAFMKTRLFSRPLKKGDSSKGVLTRC